MKRRIISLIIVVLGLLASTMPLQVVAQSDGIVSLQKAILAAQNYVDYQARRGYIPSWQEATVDAPVVYYHTDHSPAVYVFSVQKGQQDLGFITISAYRYPAVLEYSTSAAPHKAEIMSNCSETVGYDQHYPIFLAPTLYVYQIINARELNFVSIDRSVTLQLSESEFNGLVETWHQYVDSLSNGVRSFSIMAPHASKSLNVAPVLQSCDTIQPCDCSACGSQCACSSCPSCSNKCWVGCHPAASASIIRYWYEHGYSGLGGDVPSIMVSLHQDMNTDQCGATNRPNATAGIETYTSARGYTFDATCISTHSGCSGSVPAFDQLVAEIDAGRPAVIAYGGHATTGIGYNTDGQIAILNPNLGGNPGPTNVPWSSITSQDAGLITIHPLWDNCCCTYSASQSAACSTEAISTTNPLAVDPFDPLPTLTFDTVDSMPASPQTPAQIDTEPPASSNYILIRRVIGTSGSYRTSTSYVMQGTSGQTTGVSQRQSNNYSLRSGYWGNQPSGIGTTYPIYLPLVVRLF